MPGPRDPAAAPADALSKLQAVSDAALSHLSLDDLLDELLTRVRDALDADTCAVLLLDDSGRELVARAAKGIEEEVEAGVRLPVGRGFAGRVAHDRAPIAIDDVDTADILNPILREKGIKSLLGAPLIAHGRLLGVIHVGTLTPRKFDDHDVELLEIVGGRVALAVERALIYGEVVRLAELQRDFVALAAHELRTPATTVYGLATTLRERHDDLDDETLATIRDTLAEQSERLRRLVDQLLDLSRLDAASTRLSPRRVTLRPYLERVVEAVGDDRVAVDAAPDLEAVVDPDAIERIVENLLHNALRYGEPPVTVAAAQVDRHVRIAVEDRGAGVSDEFVPVMFERFRRSEQSAARTSGSGLGLAIARAYARAHGGDLFYSQASPTGARFELILPVAQQQNG
jgi:signal transduction histidine kinase